MNAQTSDRISSLAAKYANISNTTLGKMVDSRDGLNEVAHDVRSMAMSLLRQDETKGLRGFFRKVMG